MPVRPGTKKKFAVTLIMSVAAFVLLTGQFCPFGGQQQAQAPAPAPVAAAPAPVAPAPVAQAPEEPREVPAPQIDTSNLQVQSLTLTDANGNPRATLGTDRSGNPAFALLDSNGGTRSRISLDNSGNPFVDLYNSKGEIVSSYWVENDAAFLTYRDKSGAAVTIIPKESAAPIRPVAVQPTIVRPVVRYVPASRASSSNDSIMVFVANGKPNYHLRTCPRINKMKNDKGDGYHQPKKIPMTVRDAKANGYKPCPICNPPQ